jgi:stalled ribosome alternative rescue factor ArfA
MKGAWAGLRENMLKETKERDGNLKTLIHSKVSRFLGAPFCKQVCRPRRVRHKEKGWGAHSRGMKSNVKDHFTTASDRRFHAAGVCSLT